MTDACSAAAPYAPGMAGSLRPFLKGRAGLVVVAAPAEAAAVRAGLGFQGSPAGSGRWDWALAEVAPGIDLLETGVGKVNAAAAVTRRFDPPRHGFVLNLGICGTLRPLLELPLGAVVAADRSVYADEGIATPEGFQSIPQMGFPFGPFDGEGVESDAALLAAARKHAAAVGPIATVSTCSGTDALAAAVSRRTGAIAEGMEGAAIGHALARIAPGAAFIEVRVVSNSTGDRSRQVWDIRGALARLGTLAAELLAP